MSKTAAEWMADGIAFKNTKEMGKAAECFDKAIDADPNFGEAYYWKAFINADDSKLAEEAALYEKAISHGYTQNHMVFYCLGVALGKLKRKEEAIAAYEKSHALNPNHFSSYNNKGNAQMVLGRIEDAIEAYRISIKINPARLDVYEGLGPLLEEIGQKDEALKVYDEGLQRDPNDLMVNLSKGTLLTELGRYDDAIKCFKAALTKNNNAIVTNYRMGNALFACGKEEEAKQHYTVTTKQNPTSSWGFCVRGQCFYRLGMKTEAFEDFKKTRDMFAKEEGLLNWTPKQVKFIKETLHSLLESEDASGKAANIIESLDANNANNPTVKNFVTKMKKLQEDKDKVQSAVITQMAKRANDSVSTNLSELDKIKEEFQRQMEEMKKEMSKLQGNMTNLETRVKAIESNLEEMKEELNNKMDDFDKKINVELSKLDLSPEDQKKLKGYYHAYVQTFTCIHVTSQVVDSGQVQLDAGNSATTILSFFASFAPFVGDTLSKGISSIGEFLKSQEMIKNARRMKSLAPDASRMSQLIGGSCFSILQDKKKRQMILEVTDKDLRKVSGDMVQKILKFCDNLQEKVDSYLYTDLYKTAAERVGHNDANMLVEKYIKGEITPFDAQEQFVEEILKQANNKQTEEPKLADLAPTDNSAPRSRCCNMF